MTERLAYRVPEAAEALGISERSVWKLISEGEIQVVRSGKIVLVPRTAIEAFLERGMAQERPAVETRPAWLEPMMNGKRRRR